MSAPRWMKGAGLAFVLITTAACSHNSSASSTYFESPGGSVDIDIGGIEIRADNSIQYRLDERRENGVLTSKTTTMNGHEYGIRDGVFWLGELEYGAVVPGDVVEVKEGGVFVNEKNRGPLPD